MRKDNERVHFVKITPEVKLPTQSTENATGYDLFSNEDHIIKVGQVKLIKTGLLCQFRHGLDMQIRPRSGLALKYGITVLNTPGTIDADYRDELGVILVNFGEHEYQIKKGDKIAQLVFSVAIHPYFCEEIKLESTTRTGGFGSTGK